MDGGTARIITAIDATTVVDGDEVLLSRLIAEHERNTHRRVLDVAADTEYGTVDNYRWLEERGIRAAIPFSDGGSDHRTIPRSAFVYDAVTDTYRCPTAAILKAGVVTYGQAMYALEDVYVGHSQAYNNTGIIARELALEPDTVRLWRQRWLGVSGVALEDLPVATRLADEPRSGAPARITPSSSVSRRRTAGLVSGIGPAAAPPLYPDRRRRGEWPPGRRTRAGRR